MRGREALGGGSEILAHPFGAEPVQHRGLRAHPRRRRGGRSGQLAVDVAERQVAELVPTRNRAQRRVVIGGRLQGRVARNASAETSGAGGAALPRARCCTASTIQNSASTPTTARTPRSYRVAEALLPGELELQVAGEPDWRSPSPRSTWLPGTASRWARASRAGPRREPAGWPARWRAAADTSRCPRAASSCRCPGGSLPSTVGVAKYRFRSWRSMGMPRARDASPISSPRRVTFAAASGRKRAELRTTA